ncbi:DExH-box splicing factor binding site-domain-containing protein [Biscogniauxia mediterranea]|nr:DExH-box splicing factor binding site-domain-containing protein [Biscogniauxia mediterranea]
MSESASSSQAPRIAIKFGASSSSAPKSTNATRKSGQSQPPSSLGKRQRPHALNHQSESEDDDDDTGRHEVITSLGADLPTREAKRRNGEASRSGHASAPYVIGGHKNRDWKAELRAQRGAGNPRRDEPQEGISKDTEPADQDKEIKWGLNVTKKPAAEEAARPDADVPGDQGTTTAASETKPQGHSPRPPADEDKDAIDALLGKKRDPAKDLIIKDRRENSGSPNLSTGMSEQDAYKRAMQEAAEVSTIEEYSEIPEGEFGAAMLRGMGWKGEDTGSKPKEVKRRPHLMGLGSKEDEEIRKGELARKHGYRERRPRLDEYRRDREKQRRDRDDRHRDSYKSERERERERGSSSNDHRHGDRYRDRDSHRHRG